MLIPFGPLRPDLEPLDNPGALIAKNVIPRARSYGPLRAPVPFTNPVSGRMLGGISFSDTHSGSTFTIVGTATNLYRLSGSAWTSIGSGYVADLRVGWFFVKFGRRLLCGCGNGHLVSINLDTAVVTAIAASPSGATCAAVIGGYLFAGVSETLDNSDLNDPTGWTFGGVNGADTQPVATGGAVVGLTGGEIGFAFCESSIYRVMPTSGDIRYALPEVETDQGCIVPGSLIKYRSTAFYLARNGFFRFDGNGSTPIGSDAIDKTFWSDVDESQIDIMRSAIDPINKIVVWIYPSRAAPAQGVCDKLLIYNYEQERWATADLEATLIFTTVAEAMDVDSLTGTLDIDTVETSVDSRLFLGGAASLTIADASNRLATLSGATLAATVQTGEIEIGKKKAVHLKDVRAVVDGTTAAVSAQIRDYLADPLTMVTSTVDPERPQVANFNRERCRFARFTVDIPAGASWSYAMGVEIDSLAEGGGA